MLDGRKTMTRRKAWREAKIPAHLHDDPSDPTVPTPTIWQKVKPGDRLYVRETTYWDTSINVIRYRANDTEVARSQVPQVTCRKPWHLTISSIHMFRWASRLTLIVTEKRLERVQDISEEDAKAEGVEARRAGHWADGEPIKTYRTGFVHVWRDLHGDNAWSENREIVALTFTVHKSNIDAMETESAGDG